MVNKNLDVIVIGGGQSGLAAGYYLRRTGLTFTILDGQKHAGGSWAYSWDSLRLFSPAQWSSLPGMIMGPEIFRHAGGKDYYPSRNETIDYLKHYEAKYHLPVKRPITVYSVSKSDGVFELTTSDGQYFAKAVVTATGSFASPFVPAFKAMGDFKGEMIHSSQYQTPERFFGKKVAIIGEGNSGAQILAEVSRTSSTLWITQKEPRFLPDNVDGRYLFDAATQMYEAQKAGMQYRPPSLGDIVMVEPVKEAREREVFKSLRPFDHFTENSIVWANGHKEDIDAVIFCTGFKPALSHLKSLNVVDEGKAVTNGTRSEAIEGLWFVGYGNWTGFASATLIGVGRSARATAQEISNYVSTFENSKITGPDRMRPL